MRRVGLRDDGTARGQRRRRVAAGDREREREVARPEHGDGPHRREESADVRQAAHRGVVGVVDDHLEAAAIADHRGHEPQLVRGPGQLAVETDRAQRGLPVGEGHEDLAVMVVAAEGGRLVLSATWPKSNGIPLYAYQSEPIAPIEAVLGLGDSVIAEWLSSEAYEKEHQAFFEIYTGVWQTEYPLYGSNEDVAVLGGWHFPWPDGDWDELVDSQLLVLTLRDSEPWVEGWQEPSGVYRVRQRIT